MMDLECFSSSLENFVVQHSAFSLDQQTLTVLFTHYTLLMQWNTAYNLISRQADHDEILKHYYDSILLHPYLEDASSVLDIGSGAGFPGLILAILDRGRRSISLSDSVKKKAQFLKFASFELGLNRAVHIIDGRVESTCGEIVFDLITSRAVGTILHVAELAVERMAPNGRLVLLKSSEQMGGELEALDRSSQRGKFQQIEVSSFPHYTATQVVILKKGST